MKRALVAAGLPLLLALVVAVIAGKVSGQDQAIRVGSGTAGLGEQVSVTLEALNMAYPGLRAWTIDVNYDPAVVTATSCSPESGSFCNPWLDNDTVRVMGASRSGLEGDLSLASITFRCGESEGTSALTIAISVLADATPDDPQHIDASVENGRIDCVELPTPTPPVPATIRMGSGTADAGEQVSVDLEALNIPPPGLGAWLIDITYDRAVVTAVACVPQAGDVPLCNADFAQDAVRLVGVSRSGLAGDITLALITFQCATAGFSTLDLTVQTLVDATFADPQDIAAFVENGGINCVELPTHTPSPTRTATPTRTPTPSRLMGDANCSGTVDAVDALFILQFEANIAASLPCPWNADVHQDGSMDSIDAALILQLVAGLIHRLPP